MVGRCLTLVVSTPAVSDIGQLLSTDRHADALVEAAKGLLSDEPSPKRRKILTDLLHNLQDTSEVEKREDDEDWFTGTTSTGFTAAMFVWPGVDQLRRSDIGKVTAVPLSRSSCLNIFFIP